MLHTFSTQKWNETFTDAEQQQTIQSLENGGIIFFPELKFVLTEQEQQFLSPDIADPHAKNISYHADKLWGMQHLSDTGHQQLKSMLARFSHDAHEFIKATLPQYAKHLIIARTSYRPVQICGRVTSYRKDDKRLHVDAFPSAPNQGKRILRVFCNINPHGEERVWRVGEPFDKVARQFLPKINRPIPGSASLLRLLKITKSYRTAYDHYMLQMHNRMKADENYQKRAEQQEIRFPSGSTWIVQTDDVSHAAMQGQYVLEQTFYLPVTAMRDQSRSPLRILERILKQELV